jgi:hypothetical protein
MPTASVFDDPVRERGRLGSMVAGMGDDTHKPTERVANACLVTDAQEPNAILAYEAISHRRGFERGPAGWQPAGYPHARDDDTRALEYAVRTHEKLVIRVGNVPGQTGTTMADLSRSDLVLKIMQDRKMCASCPRGSRLQFAYGHWLKWRRCRRHLTVDEKAVLVLKLMEAEAGGLTDE